MEPGCGGWVVVAGRAVDGLDRSAGGVSLVVEGAAPSFLNVDTFVATSEDQKEPGAGGETCEPSVAPSTGAILGWLPWLAPAFCLEYSEPA